MSTLAYDPRGQEIPVLAGAIMMERQSTLVPRPADVDVRYIAGYIDGVCATLAACDPWGQDPADRALWAEIQRTYKYGPGYGLSSAFREYIRAAARAQHTDA